MIYPLFSKWGALSLGPAEGGVRLLYNESLSGVINWSLAAPLFSINLVLLTALLQRSLRPIRGLFSASRRWWAWSSRRSGCCAGACGWRRSSTRSCGWRRIPTWYNQDGADPDRVATLKS